MIKRRAAPSVNANHLSRSGTSVLATASCQWLAHSLGTSSLGLVSSGLPLPEWVIFSSAFPSSGTCFPSGFYSRFRTLLASFVVARQPSTNGT